VLPKASAFWSSSPSISILHFIFKKERVFYEHEILYNYSEWSVFSIFRNTYWTNTMLGSETLEVMRSWWTDQLNRWLQFGDRAEHIGFVEMALTGKHGVWSSCHAALLINYAVPRCPPQAETWSMHLCVHTRKGQRFVCWLDKIKTK
jgi:hypothetical protein